MVRRAIGRVPAAPLLAAALLAAACSDADDGAVPADVGSAATTDGVSESTTAGSAPVAATDPDTAGPPSRADGVLTIGTLLPRVGAGNQLGIAGINAVNIGVDTINAAGGVLQQPVRTVGADEGATVEDAEAGIEELLAGQVDAVIGPASSLIALEVLDDLLDAGIVVCSPTATALALNDYPGRQRFFRTVPSDSLSAQSMAIVASNTGVDSYAVVYVDDQFGRPFAEQALSRLDDQQVERVTELPFPPAATPEELTDVATELGELAPRAVVLIADSSQGWAMLEAMAAVFGTDPPTIIVNDALREAPDLDVVTGLPTEFREAIQGVSPVVPPEPSEPTGVYATNALDCLNLIALATVAADTDDPEAIAAGMVNVSVAGALCNSFAQCVGFLDDNRTINYQGPNSIDLLARGDPSRGRMGIFRFDETGLDVPAGNVAITEFPD